MDDWTTEWIDAQFNRLMNDPGQIEFFKELDRRIERGTNIYQAASAGDTAEVLAALDNCQWFKDQDLPPPTAERLDYALFLAAEGGHVETCAVLLDHGANVNAVGERAGNTPLIEAAVNGKTKTVALLLDRGADVNAKDEDGRTALIWAAALCISTKTVALLLDRGADVNAKDAAGDTALMWAERNGSGAEAVALLRAHEQAARLAAAIDAPTPAQKASDNHALLNAAPLNHRHDFGAPEPLERLDRPARRRL